MADDHGSLIETLDILADADLVKEVQEAMDDAAAGDTLTTEEVLASLPPERRGLGREVAGSGDVDDQSEH